MYPHIQLRARDIIMERGHTRLTVKPRLRLDPEVQYTGADGRLANALVEQLRLHLSVSHDGDYVIASVLAETP